MAWCACVVGLLYIFSQKEIDFRTLSAPRARVVHVAGERGPPRGKFDEASTWHAAGDVLRTVIESLVGESSEF